MKALLSIEGPENGFIIIDENINKTFREILLNETEIILGFSSPAVVMKINVSDIINGESGIGLVNIDQNTYEVYSNTISTRFGETRILDALILKVLELEELK